MERVYVLQDESSHWYVIPYEERDRFLGLLNSYCETESNEILELFESDFSKYRTGGSVNNVPLYANLDDY